MRSVVLLPAPFGPRKPVTRPDSTVNERSRTACTFPKCLQTPSISIVLTALNLRRSARSARAVPSSPPPAQPARAVSPAPTFSGVCPRSPSPPAPAPPPRAPAMWRDRLPSVSSSESRRNPKSARFASLSTARMPSRTRWWTVSSSRSAGCVKRAPAPARRGRRRAAAAPSRAGPRATASPGSIATIAVADRGERDGGGAQRRRRGTAPPSASQPAATGYSPRDLAEAPVGQQVDRDDAGDQRGEDRRSPGSASRRLRAERALVAQRRGGRSARGPSGTPIAQYAIGSAELLGQRGDERRRRGRRRR